jgi:hypothetical protein
VSGDAATPQGEGDSICDLPRSRRERPWHLSSNRSPRHIFGTTVNCGLPVSGPAATPRTDCSSVTGAVRSSDISNAHPIDLPLRSMDRRPLSALTLVTTHRQTRTTAPQASRKGCSMPKYFTKVPPWLWRALACADRSAFCLLPVERRRGAPSEGSMPTHWVAGGWDSGAGPHRQRRTATSERRHVHEWRQPPGVPLQRPSPNEFRRGRGKFTIAIPSTMRSSSRPNFVGVAGASGETTVCTPASLLGTIRMTGKSLGRGTDGDEFGTDTTGSHGRANIADVSWPPTSRLCATEQTHHLRGTGPNPMTTIHLTPCRQLSETTEPMRA